VLSGCETWNCVIFSCVNLLGAGKWVPEANEQDCGGFWSSAEEGNKKNKTTWPLNLEWQGQLKAERPRCQRVNTWKKAVEFKTKTLGIEKTKRLVAKRDRPLLSSADGSSPNSCHQLTKMLYTSLLQKIARSGNVWALAQLPLRCLPSKYNMCNS
jgi:hypothetical protein